MDVRQNTPIIKKQITMLQEAHIWTQERHNRWQKTRAKGCLNYVLKMTAIVFLGAAAVSLLYCGLALASGRDFHLSTALILPVLGALSGLITGRAYWGLSEDNFNRMNPR